MKSLDPDALMERWRQLGLDFEVKHVKPGDRFFAPDAPAPVEKPRRSKYGNHRVVIDGLTFDSKREACRWLQLVEDERAGRITSLERQVRFPLDIAGIHVCDYVADFVFIRDGRRVVEDAKGMKTPAYRLKKKMMLAIHGIEIEET